MRARTLLASLVLLAVVLGGGAASGTESVRVAVLPIVVHSIEDPRYLMLGLGDMLSSRLESDGIRVLRVEGAAPTTWHSAAAVEAGRAVRADYVLYGSFSHFGAGASLDLACEPVSSTNGSRPKTREIFVQSGQVGEIIPQLDELSEKISRYLKGDPEVLAAGAREQQSVPSPDRLEELQERVDALERAVYSDFAEAESEAAEAETPSGDASSPADSSLPR